MAAIAAGDIYFWYASESGIGTDGGGSIVSDTIAQSITDKNNIFPDVPASDASTGATHFAKVFYALTSSYTSANPSNFLSNAVVWISVNTPSTDDALAICTDTASIAEFQTNFVTDMMGVTSTSFVAAAAKTDGFDGLAVVGGTGTAGVFWIRRIVDSAASAYADNSFIFRVEGETG